MWTALLKVFWLCVIFSTRSTPSSVSAEISGPSALETTAYLGKLSLPAGSQFTNNQLKTGKCAKNPYTPILINFRYNIFFKGGGGGGPPR